MRFFTIRCDKCGAEVSNKSTEQSTSVACKVGGREFDLCQKCASEFISSLIQPVPLTDAVSFAKGTKP